MMMPGRRTLVRAPVGVAFAALPIVLLGACDDAPLEPLDAVPEARMVTNDGYEIVVTATPARATRGETVVVSSRVVRIGETPDTVWLRTCGLDIETARDFPDPSGTCFGYSGRYTMMPGDTVTGADSGIVDWPRGEHRFRVRHMVEPSRWLELTVVVE